MQAARTKARDESFSELAVIAQRAQAFTNASGTAIALSEGDDHVVICRARAGSSAPEVGTALRVEGTFTGLCIQSGKELCCDDAEVDPRVDMAAAGALGIRSIVAIPIQEEGRVVGVLAAFSPAAHAFKITDVAVLKTMAGQVAGYLQSRRRDGAYLPRPSPTPPAKAAAVSAAASAPSTAGVSKPAAPATRPPQFRAAPKVESVQVRAFTGETAPVPVAKRKESKSRDQQQKHKTDFRIAFRTFDAVAAPENRPTVAKVVLIGATVVIAVAVGLSFKLRRPAAAPQPAPETSSSPDTRSTPSPAPTDVQPPARNSPPDSAADQDAAVPRHRQTVVLFAGPSRISAAKDTAAQPSDTPSLALSSAPASGALPNLSNPVSQTPHPRLLTQSKLEPVTVIKRVRPIYPLAAKQRSLTGSIVVQGTIDKNGKIRDLQLLSGSPVFRDAAFEAVKQWVFKPARLNGQAIEQSTRIRLDFGTDLKR